MRSPARSAVAVELAALGLLAAVSWWLLGHAADAWLARASAIATERAAAIAPGAIARWAALWFSIGVAALAAARAIAARRARDPLGVPLLLPAVCAASLLGLVVHMASVDVAAGQLVAPIAARQAGGFALAGIVGALILLVPDDLARRSGFGRRLEPALLAAMVATFALLALFGSGPANTRINLGPLQPIELVKLAAVIAGAGYLGQRASKLRWQRRRWLGLRWPRPVLLAPAVAVLVALVAALYLVRDLGPTLVLAPLFIGVFYIASRASGWTALALAILSAALVLLWLAPSLAGDGTVATRVIMWKDPWQNGLDNGSQLGESLWAIAAGGATGQGLGQSWIPGPPAAHTDLVIAVLVEQLGLVGFVLYSLAIAVIAAHGFAVAANNRTPERVLMAAGLGLLLVVQWALITAGTLGLLPLTGVVAPFLSAGRTSAITFVAACALIARLAEDGRPRARTEELSELGSGVRAVALVCVVVIVALIAAAGVRALIQRRALSSSGVLAELADGTVRHRQNPRLAAIARALRRGTISDRRGEPIAADPDGGGPRRYPLGDAMGRVVGWPPGRGCPPPRSLELRLDERLRGYPERAEPVALRRGGCAGESALEPIASPDLDRFAPLLSLSPAERARALAELDADIGPRSVTLTIDARLQRAAAAALREHARPPAHAGAAVVIDADTGEVLARAQVPDLDPADVDGRARFDDPRFASAYGRWRDKTGLEGVYQTGSIGKLVTALAAARTGELEAGRGCDDARSPVLECAGDSVGRFVAPRWGRPIHDHAGARPHGDIDVIGALEVSCNVYFAQLALRLGPEPLRALVDDGVQIGHLRGGAYDFEPGTAGGRDLGETGFGQGGLAMSALQAARLVAAIGAGGVYRICPPTMELGAACEAIELVDDPSTLQPILAGMRAVIAGRRGTGRRRTAPDGLRLYGKTGTADVRGMRGEEPFGLTPGAPAPPHSWFVALVERDQGPACDPNTTGRLAIAVVIPRGGAGSGAAATAAQAIIDAIAELELL